MGALFGPAGNSDAFAASGHKKTIEAMAWLREIGLDAYEYQCGRGVNASREALEATRAEAEKHGVALSLHAPYFISLSGTEPEKRLGSLRYINESLDAADALGAYLIVIHTGSASKISREEAVGLAKDTMCRVLEENRFPGIRLGLETMGKENQLGTLGEVLDICKLDKRLWPVVDWGHMNARNLGGLFTDVDSYRRVFETIGETLGDEYANELHCHFSKIEYTDKGEKRHLTFEDTTFGPPPEPLMECIAKYGFSPRVICESAGTQSDDALYMKRCYEGYLS
ncbi:MAG: TIM barrel protein [Clostridia bacterium]|nr:TIM barrel protein [Clostridia bacterium]